MQLIVILLATVSILTFLSGLIIFFGARKGERVKSAFFFGAAVFATIWMVSISLFLTASPDTTLNIDWHVKWPFISAVMLDILFLGYVSWDEKYGRYLTYFFFVFGSIINLFILLMPHLFYNDIQLSVAGNSLKLVIGPLFIAYAIFFSLIVPAIVWSLFKQFRKSKSSRKRGGDLVIMGSFGLSSLLIMIFNMIMPLLGNWSLAWVGPLALSVTIIAFYYTILRYRALNLSSVWLKIFSYIVIIASLAIVYMVIFSLIFAALFRGSTPSIEVIILNFIMIVIFIALMPATNQLVLSVRAMISDQDTGKGKK